MEKVWVRKMGKNNFGVGFFRKFDGTNESSEKNLKEIESLLEKKTLASWDITNGVTWIKK
jgi:hypothetical protein